MIFCGLGYLAYRLIAANFVRVVTKIYARWRVIVWHIFMFPVKRLPRIFFPAKTNEKMTQYLKNTFTTEIVDYSVLPPRVTPDMRA
jgi:hypothetical protein